MMAMFYGASLDVQGPAGRRTGPAGEHFGVGVDQLIVLDNRTSIDQ